MHPSSSVGPRLPRQCPGVDRTPAGRAATAALIATAAVEAASIGSGVDWLIDKVPYGDTVQDAYDSVSGWLSGLFT